MDEVYVEVSYIDLSIGERKIFYIKPMTEEQLKIAGDHLKLEIDKYAQKENANGQ